MSAPKTSPLEWLCTGREIFPAMLEAIGAAKKSIRLETYIYSNDKLGRQFLEALVAAARRGIRVQVLVDAMGSWLLPDDFFKPLVAAGAEARRFNPLRLWRFGVRDHRKLLVCDDDTAFIGGFNISDEYDGDGVTRGWCDIGARIENPKLVAELTSSFDELFPLADFHRKPLLRLRVFRHRKKSSVRAAEQSLLNHPDRRGNSLKAVLHRDFAKARDVQIITAYFLPTRRLRRDLMRIARRGGRVQLILAGKSDVLVSQLAGQSLYRRLLKAGVEIYEYQPQILHAKLIIIDDIAYVGSANLDIRSLKLNYELMLRFGDATIVAGAREIFERTLKHCRRIKPDGWRKSGSFWRHWKHHWAHFLLARIDPFVALRQFHAMKK